MSNYSHIPLAQLYEIRADLEKKEDTQFTADDAEKLNKVRAAIGKIEMAKFGSTKRQGAWSGVER